MQFKLLLEDTKLMHVYVFSFNVYVTSLIQQSQQNKSVVEMPVYFQVTLAQARKSNCSGIRSVFYSSTFRSESLKEIGFAKVMRK